MFWVLTIIPVYSVAGFIDIVILNLIEFWSGSNPVAMREGECETQVVKAKNGKEYSITAVKNKFIIEEIGKSQKSVELNFVENESSWYFKSDDVNQKLCSIHFDKHSAIPEVRLYAPNGEVYAYQATEAGKAYATNQMQLLATEMTLTAEK